MTTTTEARCKHRWRLLDDTPESDGVCVKCGTGRRFTGGLPEDGREYWGKWEIVAKDWTARV